MKVYIYKKYLLIIIYFNTIFRGERGEPGNDGLKGDAGDSLDFDINATGDKGEMGPPGRRGIL